MQARERFGNFIEFHYEKDKSKYSKNCVKNLLDAMHGLDIKVDDVADLMELIKFIRYEDKSGKKKTNWVSK